MFPEGFPFHQFNSQTWTKHRSDHVWTLPLLNRSHSLREFRSTELFCRVIPSGEEVLLALGGHCGPRNAALKGIVESTARSSFSVMQQFLSALFRAKLAFST